MERSLPLPSVYSDQQTGNHILSRPSIAYLIGVVDEIISIAAVIDAG